MTRTTKQRGLIVLLIALLIAGALALGGGMREGREEQTTVRETPIAAVLLNLEPYPHHPRHPERGTIKHTGKRAGTKRVSVAVTPDATSTTGPCYLTTVKRFGSSATFTEVVSGTVHFHWCVGKKNPSNIARGSFRSSFDQWAWWLQGWHLSWSKVTKNGHGISSTWCTPTHIGPCYPVAYRFQQWQFQFERKVHMPFLGDLVTQHGTFYIQCTVRGNAPGVPANHECYSGKL